MATNRLLSLLVLSLASAGLAACGHAGNAQSGSTPPAASAAAPAPAHAVLQPLGNSGISGTLTFTAVDGGVRIDGRVEGLSPGTVHGFHVHEKGDCNSADGSSAGAHFNPMGKSHGAMDAMDSHAGDLGNVVADETGVAAFSAVKPGVTLGDGSPSDLLGRGLIVHAGTDDLKTQPTGGSGARIACAVISR